MRVIDLITSSEKTAFSFELLPPLKGTGIERLYGDIDKLKEFDPKYINITTHRSEYVYQELGDGLYKRQRLRRRPGTVAVAAAIQQRYGITVVPHMLCSGFTREDTEYVLLDLQFLGITDVLVLREIRLVTNRLSCRNRAAMPMPLNWRNRSTTSTGESLSTVLLSVRRILPSVTEWPVIRKSMKSRRMQNRICYGLNGRSRQEPTMR